MSTCKVIVATFALSFNLTTANDQLKECKISTPPGKVHPSVSLLGLVGHDAAQREGATWGWSRQACSINTLTILYLFDKKYFVVISPTIVIRLPTWDILHEKAPDKPMTRWLTTNLQAGKRLSAPQGRPGGGVDREWEQIVFDRPWGSPGRHLRVFIFLLLQGVFLVGQGVEVLEIPAIDCSRLDFFWRQKKLPRILFVMTTRLFLVFLLLPFLFFPHRVIHHVTSNHKLSHRLRLLDLTFDPSEL